MTAIDAALEMVAVVFLLAAMVYSMKLIQTYCQCRDRCDKQTENSLQIDVVCVCIFAALAPHGTRICSLAYFASDR